MAVRKTNTEPAFKVTEAAWVKLWQRFLRLERKINHATGFAVNGPDTLAAHAPQKAPRSSGNSNPEARRVVVSTALGGRGHYDAFLLTRNATPRNPAVDLDLADYYTAGEAIILTNLADHGLPENILEGGDYVFAFPTGERVDGKAVYETRDLGVDACDEESEEP